MNVNITFLIQITNFSITYYFLKKLLLQPFVGVLEKRKEIKKVLLEGVRYKKLILKQRIEEKSLALITFQRNIKKYYSFLRIKKSYVSTEVISKPFKIDLEKLVSKGASFLVRKISYGD